MITEYIEAGSYPTPEEALAAQKACCGRVCSLCESPAEYAWRRRTVDLGALALEAVESDLSEKERGALVKHLFEGMTLTAIAAESGRSVSGISRTLARAKRKLEDVLKYAVKYQYNLEHVPFLPLAVRKALAAAAASRVSAGSFGERLRALRNAENIPAVALAEAAGFTPKRLLSLEAGKAAPGAAEIVRLAAFFERSTDYLLYGG